MKSLKIKNYLVTPLANWLTGQALPGKQSRARNRFVKVLSPRVQEIDENRREIAKTYAKKDKKGEVVVEKDKENPNIERYVIEDQNKFKEEMTEFLNEEFVIDITPSNTKDIQDVKDVVLLTNQEFKDDPNTGEFLATYYDEWCSAFEALDK